MSAQILDGKQISAEIRQNLKSEVDSLVSAGGNPPGLAVVLVGENPASQVYVRNKIKACEDVGIKSFAHRLPEDTPQEKLVELIETLNKDDAVNGILVQLPLPAQIDENIVNQTIDPAKDVDGFLPYNIGSLVLRQPTLRPCTPFGVIKMIEHANIDLTGLDAVIVGQSNIVGRPIAFELLMKRCTVTICHSKTKDLEAKVKAADVVVAAIGRPEYIKGEWIKSGAIVIDVGINRLDSGKLVGDVEFASAKEKASYITPVPGGVGPMTIAMLLHNTVSAYRQQQS